MLYSNRLGLPGLTRITIPTRIGAQSSGRFGQWCPAMSDYESLRKHARYPCSSYKTNMALYVRLLAACWVPLHEGDGAQGPGEGSHSAPPSCAMCPPRILPPERRRTANGADLSFRYASKLYLLLHLNHHFGPL